MGEKIEVLVVRVVYVVLYAEIEIGLFAGLTD